MLWMHSIDEGKRGEAAPRQLSGRGLSYWSDGKEERIIYVTPGLPDDRARCEDRQARRQLRHRRHRRPEDRSRSGRSRSHDRGDRPALPRRSSRRTSSSIGAAHREGGFPKSKNNVKGYIRGFDVRTGKRVWVFHTIPMKGEAGFETWDPDARNTPATPACGRR
jgi:quinoprotein glucose dehydrogenase